MSSIRLEGSGDPDYNKINIMYLIQTIHQAALLEQFADRILTSCTDAAVTKWFKGGEFGSKVVTVTRELCDCCLKDLSEEAGLDSGQEEARWALLKLALSSRDNMGERTYKNLFIIII